MIEGDIDVASYFSEALKAFMVSRGGDYEGPPAGEDMDYVILSDGRRLPFSRVFTALSINVKEIKAFVAGTKRNLPLNFSEGFALEDIFDYPAIRQRYFMVPAGQGDGYYYLISLHPEWLSA